MTVSKDVKRQLRKKLRAAKRALVDGIHPSVVPVSTRKSFPIKGRELSIQYKIAPLPLDLLRDFMKMFEENMASLYRNSSWGLNLDEKRDELSDANAQFLVAYQNVEGREQMIGYCHFRFECDDEDEPTDLVAYVYELQVSSRHQKCGIGRQLMKFTHDVTQKAGLSKVMLTVFHANDSAGAFYAHLGYSIDSTSPSRNGQVTDYEIMSKVLSSGHLSSGRV